MNAWLGRLRGDGRTFDYAQGFVTAFACAAPSIGDPPEEVLLLAILDDPAHAELPKGLGRDDLLAVLGALFEAIGEELDEGSFHPYIGGRYVNRLREDAPREQWLNGFLTAFFALGSGLEEDEDLSALLVPFVLLSGAKDEESLSGLSPEELAEARATARQAFIGAIHELYAYFADAEDVEEDEPGE